MALSQSEKAISYNTLRELSTFLGLQLEPKDKSGRVISRRVFAFIGIKSNLCPNTKSATKLRQKYGSGAFVFAFRSFDDFKMRKFSNMWAPYVPSDCNLGIGIYATDDILNLIFPSFRVESKQEHTCIAIIYLNWPESILLLGFSVENVLNRADVKRLMRFLHRNRLSATVLRRRYPEYLHMFRRDNFVQVVRLGLIAYCPSLKEYAEMIMPSHAVINACIDDDGQGFAIQQIVKNVLAKCRENAVDWMDWEETLGTEEVSYLNWPQSVNRFCYSQYPFIKMAIASIGKIVGEVTLGKLMGYFKVHPTFKRFAHLSDLCIKIEGRNCVYPGCSNQESRDGMIEKYKTCSACRIVFYCSRRCQKRDWKKVHKYICYLVD